MSDTILRQLEMLRLIPHHPRKIDSTGMNSLLAGCGFEITARTVQRDLQKLSLMFPIQCDESPGRFGWSWMENSDPITLTAMPPHVAITFKMVEQFLTQLLPAASSSHLASYFKAADGTLQGLSDQSFAKWSDKVCMSQRAHALIAPELSQDVIDAIYTGVFTERCLEIEYRTAKDERIKDAVVHPQGLIVRGPVIYLLCTFWGYDDVRQLPLHRINNAKLTDTPATLVEHFSVAQYIEDNQQDIVLSDEIQLKARISRQQATYLAETPLAKTQQLVNENDDYSLLTATLKDTLQLRRWLLSMTGELEVLEPLELRKVIFEKIKQQNSIYSPS